jgi:pyruvate dehydrogenase E1 component alpha subunit
VIENNKWGMGTAIEQAISVAPIAEKKAASFNMAGYTLDGMDFFNCYAGFTSIYQEILKTSRPALVEVVTERFRGHSISDPGLYRTKESLKDCMKRDPLLIMKQVLIEEGFLEEEDYKQIDKKEKETVIEAMRYADQCAWPDPRRLGEDVYAP